ncbi:MAG: DUF1345 domain-containing protein [Xanthobacteraceae bacterium]|jgi:uncharacterized membrane protein
MNEPSHQHRRPLPRAVRIVRARPRLFLCALIGLIVIAALPGEWQLTTRMLIGWDTGIALYLAAALGVMARADLQHIRRQSALQDEGRVAILVLTVAAALASIAAIIVELGTTPGATREPIRLVLATITIVLSWAFIHTIFALHYAHEYHAEHRKHRGGLAFPGDEPPDYWDFVYFSFVIGMAAQTSDVAITSKAIRRTVAAHGIVSFVFNAALLALTVNIAASAI